MKTDITQIIVNAIQTKDLKEKDGYIPFSKDELLQWDMETENNGIWIVMSFSAVKHFDEKKDRFNDPPPTMREWKDDFRITSADFYDKDDNEINEKVTFDKYAVLEEFMKKQNYN